MKKLFTVTAITLLAGTVASHAQGYICWAGFVRNSVFDLIVWSPNSNNVPIMGNVTSNAADISYNLNAIPGPVGVIGTALNGCGCTVSSDGQSYIGTPSNIGSSNGLYYDGIPVGGTSTDVSVAGWWGNGAHWEAAFFAAPGTNNLAGLLQAEINFQPYATSPFEEKAPPPYLVGVPEAAENDDDISGMWQLDHNRPPGQCVSGPLPGGAPGSFPTSGGATVQILVWEVTDTNGNSYGYNTSPIVGMSSTETIDTLGTSTASCPNLGVITAKNTFGGADTNFPVITDWSLVNVVAPKLSSVKQGTNVIITVNCNSAFGINPGGDGNGMVWNLITSTNAAAPRNTWSIVQTGMMPAATSTLTSFTITNGITSTGNHYFALVLPNYPDNYP